MANTISEFMFRCNKGVDIDNGTVINVRASNGFEPVKYYKNKIYKQEVHLSKFKHFN